MNHLEFSDTSDRPYMHYVMHNVNGYRKHFLESHRRPLLLHEITNFPEPGSLPAMATKLTIDPCHKSHILQCTNPISRNTRLCNRNMHMRVYFCVQNFALWDIYLMYCGIGEMGQYISMRLWKTNVTSLFRCWFYFFSLHIHWHPQNEILDHLLISGSLTIAPQLSICCAKSAAPIPRIVLIRLGP